jgi:plasmid stabilization system protein ParE
MRVRFTAPARRELFLEVAQYSEIEPGLGARFAEAIEEATTRAIALPLAGSRASKNTRRVFVKRFPFSIVYRADEDGIVVFAVAHSSRRPDYWLSRVQEPAVPYGVEGGIESRP